MNPNRIEICKVKLNQYVSPLTDIRNKTIQVCEPLKEIVNEGSTIAVGVGSRGINNIDTITKAVVDFLKEIGADVFIVPAMGSHGGATAEGQSAVLGEYGITAETMGVEIRSSMDVVKISEVVQQDSFPIYFDKNALSADGVVVINRVKSHTDFHGIHESGIVKMLVIGMGKHKQALEMHRFGANGLSKLIPVAAKEVLENANIIGGIAILEDGAENTSDIVFAKADMFFETDVALLQRSRQIMAKLPFEEIDVLIVDEMGKDISGTGMDTNVIGRLRIKGQTDTAPECERIVVLDLTDVSHGNATGIGLADITTEYVRDKINWEITNENVITSGFYERGFLPLIASDDLQAVKTALRGNYDEDTVRLVRIKNTLDLSEIYISKSLLAELNFSGKGEQITDFKNLSFINGKISDF